VVSNQPETKPRILVIDIEWRPVTAYVWRAWDENISPEQIIEDGGLLCVGAKWLGQPVRVFTEWDDGHVGMLEKTRDLIAEADCVIGFNSDKYDLPKLEGEFIRYGIRLPPRPASIDLIKTIKKLGYFRNALGFVAPFLGVGKKLEHEGFALWKKVLAGDGTAEKRMARYCEQDVRLTERLYRRILPAIRNHPNIGRPKGTCPTCGSKNEQKRGKRYTRYFAIQRHECENNHWFDGVRTKL
jgi:hypothetical protein